MILQITKRICKQSKKEKDLETEFYYRQSRTKFGELYFYYDKLCKICKDSEKLTPEQEAILNKIANGYRRKL